MRQIFLMIWLVLIAANVFAARSGSLLMNAGGNYGIGTTEPQASLEIGSATMITPGSDPLLAINGNLVVDGQLYGDGSKLTNLVGASSQWTTAGSDIYYDTGNVGIGTSAPLANLHVGAGAASMTLSRALGANDALIKGRLEVDSNVYLNGNVGIGTPTPNNLFHVNQYISFDPGTLYNTRIGYQAGLKSDGVNADKNTFIGHSAGQVTCAASCSGGSSVAIGYQALTALTSGNYNVALGSYSLIANKNGGSNVALGVNSLYSNVAMSKNTAVGYNALYFISNGGTATDTFNTAVGYEALKGVSASVGVGTWNTAVGANSMIGIGTSSVYNATLGYQAGRYITGGATALSIVSNGVFLGANTQALANSSTNEIVIGYGATGLGSNTVVLGNVGITTTVLRGNVGIDTTAPVSRLHVGTGAAGMTLSAVLGTNDALIRGRLEVDGGIYTLGNVGIGTAIPAQELEVIGNIKVSKGVQITAVPSTDTTVSGVYMAFVAGESLTFGQVVYIKSDGKAWKADATTVSTVPAVAMAMGSISADASGSFLLFGVVRKDDFNWATKGGKIYLTTTAGAMSQTAPSATDQVVQIVGVATDTDYMLFNPQLVYATLN